MSDKLTAVYIPKKTGGFSDLGDQDPEEMIQRLREKARKDIAEAQAILDAPDSEFVVESYRGPYAQRDRKRLWPR